MSVEFKQSHYEPQLEQERNTNTIAFASHTYQPPRTFLDLSTGKRVDIVSGVNDMIWEQCYRQIWETPPLVDARPIPPGGIFSLYGTLREWWKDAHPEGWEKVRANINAIPGKEYQILGDPFLHPIMPLLPENDQDMLVKIGKQAFEDDFGFAPKGFWLPETGISEATLRILKKNGYEFVVLRDFQVESGEKNPMFVPLFEGSEYIGDMAVIHCDSGLSGRISFQDEESDNGDTFLGKYQGTNVAFMSDTEFYGHHKKWRDYFITYVTQFETMDRYGFKPFDVKEALEDPDKRYTKIREKTSWSCDHQLGRWTGGCACDLEGKSDAERGKVIDDRRQMREGLSYLGEAVNGQLDGISPGWRNDFIKFFLETKEAMYVKGDIDVAINRLIGQGVERLENPEIQLLFKANLARLTGETSCAWFFGGSDTPERDLAWKNINSGTMLLRQVGERALVPFSKQNLVYQAA